MLEDSLAVGSITVDKWCFGPLQRLVMEKNLQLSDDSRKELSDALPALSDKMKAAILDHKDERRHARAMGVWALLVKLLSKASSLPKILLAADAISSGHCRHKHDCQQSLRCDEVRLHLQQRQRHPRGAEGVERAQ